MVKCEVPLSVDIQVIHVYFQPAFSNHICKDVVHKGLESGWSIAESKEYDGWFEESERSDECAFPLVFVPNANVVEPPSNIEHRKNSTVFHVINQFGNQR